MTPENLWKEVPLGRAACPVGQFSGGKPLSGPGVFCAEWLTAPKGLVHRVESAGRSPPV